MFLGRQMNLHFWKDKASCYRWFMYNIKCYSFNSRSSIVWLITNMESPNILTFVTPRAIRPSIPSAHASYSASLFVTPNASFLAIGTTSPSGVRSIISTHAPNWLTAPSKYIHHPCIQMAIFRSFKKSSWIPFESEIELRARNSVTALHFIIFWSDTAH